MADMIGQVKDANAGGRARARALIVPREHGAWGLLIVPLFTGLAAGLGPAQRFWPLVLFAAAALSLFWLRTPVENLLGSGPMTARTAQERWIAVSASAILAAVAAGSLIMLMWNRRNLQLLFIGLIAALAFVVQTALRGLGRKVRMPSQLAGAIGLTATAPAAYYLGTGRLDSRTVVLWLANWLFAWNQIQFVQLRIHAARASTFAEKFARGKLFFFSQIALCVALGFATAGRVTPLLVVVAFLPAFFRGTRWFFRQAETLDVKKLGWSEMKQGAAFGILLALAFLFR